jgi:hypothetical protein
MNRKLGKRKRRMTGEKHNPTANSDHGAANEQKRADAPPMGISSGDQNPETAAIGQETRQGQASNEPLSVKIFALVAAIGGFAAALFSGLQWHVASDTEIVSNAAVLISNSIRFISYDDVSNNSRAWEVAPIIENTGNTSTKNLRYNTGLGICPNNPIKETFDKQLNWVNTPKSEIFRSVIGPKSEITGATLPFANVTINCVLVASAVGVLRFNDVWGYPHLTEFCAVIRSRHIDFQHFPVGQPIRLGGFACPYHNCTDEDCGSDWKQRAAEE